MNSRSSDQPRRGSRLGSARSCAELAGPWGEVPAGRLVIATDFAGALRRYLRPDRYRAWERRQRDRAAQATGIGMGFVATDGVPTAVAMALPEATNRSDLLSLCCHELCELSIGDTDARGHDTLRAVMSGIIWSEHVAERRRAEVFLRHRWPKGVFGRRASRAILEGLPRRVSSAAGVGGSERRASGSSVRHLADPHPRRRLRLWTRSGR